MDRDSLETESICDVLSELPPSIFSSIDPLLQSAVLRVSAGKNMDIAPQKLSLLEHRERPDLLQHALDIAAHKIGQLCRFLDVEELQEAHVYDIQGMVKELDQLRTQRVECIMRVEQRVVAILQTLSSIVEKYVLEYEREFNLARKESLIKSAQMIQLLSK